MSVSPFVTYSGTDTVNQDGTVLWTSADEDGFTGNSHLSLAPESDKFTFIGVDSLVVGEGDVLTTVQESVGVGVAYRVER